MKCEDCYIEVKKWTRMKGIVLTIFFFLGMLIPILNIFIIIDRWNDGRKFPEDDLGEGWWYDTIDVPVKKW